MYGGNYAGPYQGAPDQMAPAPVGQYQAAPPAQPMPGQQPMMGQPQQQIPGQQPMMGQPQQQMPGQQPMMDQQQQMPGQQPMMDQQQQMPGQQSTPDTLGTGPSGGVTETDSADVGNTWMIVTILAGVGIAAVLASLLMLFLGEATTEVDIPSILLLVASICGIVCLATGLMYNSGKFAANKIIPGSTGVLACLISGGAVGMAFADLETSAYIVIVAALVFLVGGILGFLAKSPEKGDAHDDADDDLESFLADQPMQPGQQFPDQQQVPPEQQMPPGQQFPGQQQMPPEQQFPGQQPMPQQQMPPGQQFPGQQPMPQQQMPPGQQPMQQQQMFGGYPPQ